MTFVLYSPMVERMSRYTKANHRVFMQFVRREVWHVTFLEPGLQKPLPKTLTFNDEGKIRELARRGEACKHQRIGNCWTTRLRKGRAVCTCAYRLNSTLG